MNRNLLSLILMTLTVLSSNSQAAQAELKIEIQRTSKNSTATFGEMYVSGKFLCYTLEPGVGGGPANKGPIPKGTFDSFLRYDHEDRWRIQLEGVLGFEAIQIHKGNSTADTAGCILVGMVKDDKGKTLTGSADAYKALKKAFYGTDTPNSTPDKSISITIKDPTN